MDLEERLTTESVLATSTSSANAMSGRRVRLAAVQDAPVAFSLSESILKFSSLVRKATSAPHYADVVVFPEAFLCCYPRGHDFGAVIGSRSPSGREWFRRYYDSSIDLSSTDPDSPWQKVLSIVRECNKAIVVLGVIEKEESASGTLYCTAVTIGKDGEVLAKHRKTMPTASERLVWGQGDGSGIQVPQTSVGKVGHFQVIEETRKFYRLIMGTPTRLCDLRRPSRCVPLG